MIKKYVCRLPAVAAACAVCAAALMQYPAAHHREPGISVATIDVDTGMSTDADTVHRITEAGIRKQEAQDPDTPVYQTEYPAASELVILGAMGKSHLPDVFVLRSTDARQFYGRGLLMDIPEAAYGEAAKPFTYDGAVYAVPIPVKSYAVVLYDPEAWKPGNQVGICCSINTLFSCMAADEEGQENLSHIVNGDRAAAFTDGYFTERLEEMKRYKWNRHSIEDFADGKCSAILTETDDSLSVTEEIRKLNPGLYERLAFAAFDGTHVPQEYSYGYCLNTGLKNDPEKMRQCVRLCEALCEEAETLRTRDPEMQKKWETFLAGTESAALWNRYLISTFWAQSDIASDDVPKTTRRLQTAYEEYYLQTGNFSKKMNKYLRNPEDDA